MSGGVEAAGGGRPVGDRGVRIVTRVRSDRRVFAAPRRHLPAAAGLTVAVTVVTDAAAGESAWHVATLGLVALLVAVVRWRMAGRDRGLSQLVSACVVAQPAVHAAAKLVPHGTLEHAPAGGVGHVDVAVTVIQLAVAVAIVGVVSFAERIVAVLVAAFGRGWARVRGYAPHLVPDRSRVRRAPRSKRLSSQYRPGVVPTRGPPARLAAV